MDKMSKSHEDYLEAIVMLGGAVGSSVRSVDVANKLGVSKASVNKAIGLLKDKGLVEQPYYGDITLPKRVRVTAARSSTGIACCSSSSRRPSAYQRTVPTRRLALWNMP